MNEQQQLPVDPLPTLAVSFDPDTDCLTVEGVKYSGDLFRGLALWPVDQRLRIVKREDGVVTLERLDRKSIRRRAPRQPAPVEQHENGDGV